MDCTVAYLRPVPTPALLRVSNSTGSSVSYCATPVSCTKSSSAALPSTVIALSEQALKVGLDLIDAFPLTTGRLDAILGMIA
jgi:hypothetical protein